MKKKCKVAGWKWDDCYDCKDCTKCSECGKLHKKNIIDSKTGYICDDCSGGTPDGYPVYCYT